MAYEREGQIDPQEIRDIEKKEELLQFAVRMVEECAVAVANDRPGDMAEWGVSFYMGMLTRIGKIDDFFEGKLDLDRLREAAVDRARKIDEGADSDLQPVWRTNSKDEREQVRISNVIENSFVGLTAELATLDVLSYLDVGEGLTLIHGGETMLPDFDRSGKADFLLLKMGQGQALVGIQVKRYRGNKVNLFNAADEEGYLEFLRVVNDLKASGQMNASVNMETGRKSFEYVTKKYFGPDFPAVLLYMLVGHTTIDKKSGLFVEEVRAEVEEAVGQLVEGKTAVAVVE